MWYLNLFYFALFGPTSEFIFVAPFWNLKDILRLTKLTREIENETLVGGKNPQEELNYVMGEKAKGRYINCFEAVMHGDPFGPGIGQR